MLKAVLIIALLMAVFTRLLLDGGRMFALWSLLSSVALIGLSITAMLTTPEGTRRCTLLRGVSLGAGIALLALTA